MKITRIKIPIYFGTLEICIADDFVEASRKLKIRHKKHPENYGAFVNVNSFGVGQDFFTVVLKPIIYHDTIAHEVVHLVNHIFIERGIQLDRKNDEAQAYLTGWVTEQIYKAYEKY